MVRTNKQISTERTILNSLKKRVNGIVSIKESLINNIKGKTSTIKNSIVSIKKKILNIKQKAICISFQFAEHGLEIMFLKARLLDIVLLNNLLDKAESCIIFLKKPNVRRVTQTFFKGVRIYVREYNAGCERVFLYILGFLAVQFGGLIITSGKSFYRKYKKENSYQINKNRNPYISENLAKQLAEDNEKLKKRSTLIFSKVMLVIYYLGRLISIYLFLLILFLLRSKYKYGAEFSFFELLQLHFKDLHELVSILFDFSGWLQYFDNLFQYYIVETIDNFINNLINIFNNLSGKSLTAAIKDVMEMQLTVDRLKFKIEAISDTHKKTITGLKRELTTHINKSIKNSRPEIIAEIKELMAQLKNQIENDVESAISNSSRDLSKHFRNLFIKAKQDLREDAHGYVVAIFNEFMKDLKAEVKKGKNETPEK